MATIDPLLIDLPPLTSERLLMRAPCAGDGVALNEAVVDGQPRDTVVYSRVRGVEEPAWSAEFSLDAWGLAAQGSRPRR